MSAAAPAGAFAPFASRPFLVLWAATVVSNIGTSMNATASGWLMTELGASPAMIAGVQAASNLPLFMFALLAGALADLTDKRRLLIVVQILTCLAGTVFAWIVWSGAITPLSLLVFTFLMATGGAFVAPAWQSIIPQLVERPLLSQAVALNSMGINVARAIGPALAGVLIALYGIWLPFALDALSFLAVIAALIWWRAAKRPATALPPERIGAAMIGGLRYAAASPELRATLIRAIAFFTFASAVWALLPIIVRDRLAGDAALFGVMMGCVGAGAVAGALVRPKLSRWLTAPRAVAAGAAGVAIASLLLALASHAAVAAIACAVMGVAWILALSSLNVSAQLSLPDWVRARGLAIFTTFFFGAMTLGSIVWGQVATRLGVEAALIVAGAGALAAFAATARLPLQAGSGPDLTPSGHWPEPMVALSTAEPHGPVLVTVEYRVDPGETDAALAAIRALAPARRRGGAYGWQVFVDAKDPGRIVEQFEEADWHSHMRHHERVTNADRMLQEAAHAYHRGASPPKVTHYLTPTIGT